MSELIGWLQVLGVVVDLVLFGLLVMWMVRIIGLLERTAKAQERIVQQMQARPQMPPAAAPPTPTQSVFG